MIDPLFILSEAMNTDLFRMRSISQNLSNVNTPGYKREIATVSAFESLLGTSIDTASASSENDQVFRKLVTDFKAGALKFTGNSNDVAIGSDAFFVVEDVAGEVYTRKGKFTVDHNGYLTLESGQHVLGASGDIRLSMSPFAIGRDGTVEQDGVTIDQLRTVRFNSTESVQYLGHGLFAAEEGNVEPLYNEDPNIAQGYIEASNVDTADEMIHMMETVRHFESAAKVLQGYDGMLDTAINVLADMNK